MNNNFIIMGSSCCGKSKGLRKTIKVQTLNYCGIPNSPFEFYISDYEPQLKMMGKIFQELCVEAFGENYDLKQLLGSVEKNYKLGRYSPMYEIMAGVKDTHDPYIPYKPMSQADFKSEWQVRFKKQEAQIVKKCDCPLEEILELKENLKQYDFLAYKALFQYVYRKELSVCVSEPKFSLEKYLRVLQPFFEFSFLDEQNKLSKFRYGYRKTNPDLFFIQERGKDLLLFLEKRATRNFFWFDDEKKEQLIIFKKDAFDSELGKFTQIKIEDKIVDENIKDYKKNDMSYKKIMALESPNFIILGIHFTSRTPPNILQKEYLINLLTYFHTEAEEKGKTFIAGGDINSFMTEFDHPYDFYPKREDDITTFKKRTALQAQKQKKDKRIKKSIDKIITNGNILSGSITLIDGVEPDLLHKKERQAQPTTEEKKQNGDGLKSRVKMLLPCDIHPFDQFLVKTEISIPNYNVDSSVLQELIMPHQAPA